MEREKQADKAFLNRFVLSQRPLDRWLFYLVREKQVRGGCEGECPPKPLLPQLQRVSALRFC